MSKSLGQVAREAYEDAVEAHARSEHQLGFPRDSFWQAAAEAVMAVTTAPNIVSGTIDTMTGNLRVHSPAELTAREAVIEAAKAYRDEAQAGESETTLAAAEWKLVEAVEALQEAEDG